MWITTNGLGQQTTWYSEEEYRKLQNERNEYIDKFFIYSYKHSKLKNTLSEIKNTILSCINNTGFSTNTDYQIIKKINETEDEQRN